MERVKNIDKLRFRIRRIPNGNYRISVAFTFNRELTFMTGEMKSICFNYFIKVTERNQFATVYYLKLNSVVMGMMESDSPYSEAILEGYSRGVLAKKWEGE